MMVAKLPLQLLKIAQRFNAGPVIGIGSESRKGRKNSASTLERFECCHASFVPSGLAVLRMAGPALKRWAIVDLKASIPVLAAQQFHDIAPPVDYSLLPTWVIFVGTFFVLTLIGGIIWLISRRKPVHIKSPRERTLELLDRIENEIQMLSPYQFSIRVSDILRRYVTEQYNLPVTRQTSIEFLNVIKTASPFSEDEKALLKDFLDRCDLIKFARYEATTADSKLLLDEATRFVKGGQLATA
jgi:uncharacterized protein DUF4381